MNKLSMVLFLLVTAIVCSCNSPGLQKGDLMGSVIWDIDNISSIYGQKTEVLGSPKVTKTAEGKAVEFDGAKDGLIVDSLPLCGAEKFTLEIIFRPVLDGLQAQRFLHLQENHSENRILIETRLTETGQWYLDTYIKCAKDDHTLVDSTKTHPLGQWYNATLVYDGQMMRHYVNGTEEMSAGLDFDPLKDGKTSIGVRINKVHWFKGTVRKIRFTPMVLEPEQLLRP